MKNRVKARLYGKTDVGCVRENNEDSYIVIDLLNGNTPLPTEELQRSVNENRLLLAVADGMGGAAAGEVASRLAIEALRAEFLHFPGAGSATRLIGAIEQINRQILEAGRRNRQYAGMATTITAALVEGNKVYIAEVGDSRAYLIRGGRIKQITTDQSWVELMVEQGLITRDAAQASNRRNVILQSLGGQADVKVALTAVELAAGDTLLLCSDGLSEKLFNHEMMSILQTAGNIAAAGDEMIAIAKERGGEDNITLALARFEGEGLSASPAAEEIISHIEVISVFDHVADMGVRDTRKFSSELRGRADFNTTMRAKSDVPNQVYPFGDQLKEQAAALAEYTDTLRLALEQQLRDLDQLTAWQLGHGKLDLPLQQALEGLKSAAPTLARLQAALAECNDNLSRCLEKHI